MTKKTTLIGIFINLLLFVSILYMNNVSILLFLSAIYIAPAIVNCISFNKTKHKQPIYLLPLITTLFYMVFSYLFMRQPNFVSFVTENSKTIGDLTIQINENLLAIGPIIFVFLINIAGIYLSTKLLRREQYVNC